MIRADEIRKGDSQIKLLRTILGATPLRLKAEEVAADLVQSVRPEELNLSGSQVLVVMSMFWLAGFLVWSLFKFWLFGR